jgi:hypothetical protein
MAINKIIKLNLESRAIELRGEDKSFAIIAKMLSDESKEKINESSVQRFFAARDQAVVQAVEKSDKLKAKVAEAEINTIDEAMKTVEELREISKLAKDAGDYRTAAIALDKVYTGLDIVNKVLGKYKVTMPDGNAGVNVVFYLPGNNRDEKVVDVTDSN